MEKLIEIELNKVLKLAHDNNVTILYEGRDGDYPEIGVVAFTEPNEVILAE